MNHPNPLDNIRIVLSHTSHPGNIGAAARAMKTMGIHSMYLINPKSFPDKEAEIRAVNAKEILNQTQICTDISTALDGTVMAAAITARPRSLGHEIFDSHQGARKLINYAHKNPTALVFGTESSGLTSKDVHKCPMTIHIPASSDYSSINLACAVQIMCYELHMAVSDTKKPSPDNLASLYDVELLFCHLEKVMITSNFFNPQKPKRLRQRIRRLFSRARLEKSEVKLLRGFLSSLEKSIKAHE